MVVFINVSLKPSAFRLRASPAYWQMLCQWAKCQQSTLFFKLMQPILSNPSRFLNLLSCFLLTICYDEWGNGHFVVFRADLSCLFGEKRSQVGARLCE